MIPVSERILKSTGAQEREQLGAISVVIPARAGTKEQLIPLSAECADLTCDSLEEHEVS